MAELIYRFPSKVPYGYVELKVEIDRDPTPEEVATQYIESFLKYRDAEEKALNAPNSAPPKSKPATKPIEDVLSEDEATDLIKRELGATEVSDDSDSDAPWNNKPEAEEKPYVKPASEDDWDF